MEYAFWPCDEGSGTTITSTGDHAITLDRTGNDCWANTGWLTLDGATYFDKAWGSLSASEQAFLTPGSTDVMAVWCELELVTGDDFTGAGIMCPVNWGQNSGTRALVQPRIDYPYTSGLLRLRLRDGTTSVDLSGGHQNPAMDQRRVFMTVIDPNKKSCWMFRNRYLSNGNVDFRSLGAITPNTGYLRIGAGINWDNSAHLFQYSRLRNIGILNMGTSPPKGIDNTLRDILVNNGDPRGIL